MGAVSVQIIPDGRVVYGIQLPIQAQSSIFVAGWERQSGPEELVRIARQADRSGFFYVAVCDHVAVPRRLADAMGTTWYDTVATLGMLAGVTERVRLLSHVFVPAYRHPLVAAKAFATLDALSGGRLIAGVGAGHLAEEFATLGVDFANRGRILDEAIDVIDAALRSEFPDVDGPTWSVHDMGLAPRPVQSPRPPIWVGGSSKAALRRAAAKGDGWLPQGTPRAQMPERIAYLLEERRRVRGEDPIAIGFGTAAEWVYVGQPPFEVGDGTLVGRGEKIAESLNEVAALGVSHFQLWFKARSCDELVEQMEAFGSEVAPHLGA